MKSSPSNRRNGHDPDHEGGSAAEELSSRGRGALAGRVGAQPPADEQFTLVKTFIEMLRGSRGCGFLVARLAAAYDQLLANLFVLEQVPAWSTNRLKRLVKASKRYIVDSSLAASGSGLSLRTVMAEGDLFGRLIDTFVLSQLRPEAALSIDPCRMHHLRTESGRHEIDLVVEREAGRVLGIEIKACAAPRDEDAKHLHWLRGELGARFIAGAVLHTGPSIYRLGDRILAIPICALWG